MRIILFFKDAAGTVINRKVDINPKNRAIGPEIIIWNDGIRVRYFARYYQSRDYFEAVPTVIPMP